MESVATPQDVLLAYNADFTGFDSQAQPLEATSAVSPTIGGTADPDGHYEDYTELLAQFVRDYPHIGGSEWGAVVVDLDGSVNGPAVSIVDFVTETKTEAEGSNETETKAEGSNETETKAEGGNEGGNESSNEDPEGEMDETAAECLPCGKLKVDPIDAPPSILGFIKPAE